MSDVPSTSKTIDMLLEMQGRNPGLAAGERLQSREIPAQRPRNPAAAAAPDTQLPGAPAMPAFAAPAGVNGARTGPPAAPGEAEAIEWNDAGARAGIGGAQAGVGWSTGTAATGVMVAVDPMRSAGRSPSDSGAEERWVIIPRAVVRFVRENRDMVIAGSVAVLLALWAASTFASSRRK